MAGWANGDAGNGPRKKWNLTGERSLASVERRLKSQRALRSTDNSSLDNLKNQLAQDGCSDLQYDLAQQLLKEELSDEVSVESHHQGIDWLLRAANQGHEKAIVLLGACYATRRGINDSNECEVRLCLEMSPAERAARKAARELFLCLSNGGEFITASQLENKMREIYQMDRGTNSGARRRLASSAPQQYLNHRHNSEILTEANLITAAVSYSNGQLPNVNNLTLCVTTPHPDSLNHIPSFYRPLFHPLLFVVLLYHRVVEQLAALPERLWQYRVPLMLLLYVVCSKEKQFLLQVIPTALYLLATAFMVLATFRMLKAKHDFMDFRLWAGLFQHFGRELAMYRENTEAQFLRNNLRPYLYFFVALTVNLLLRPFVRHEFLPYAEITVVALSLAFVTAVVFTCSSQSHNQSRRAGFFPNIFIILSLLVNVLAKYPYDIEHAMESSWQLFGSFVPGFDAESRHKIGSSVELRLNFRGLFYLLIPVLLVQIGSAEKWRGVYKYLMPHCVTLSWMQLGMSFAQDSTVLGLVRATVELLTTVLFLPLMGLVTMILPVLPTVEAFLMDQKVKIVAFIVLATTLIILYGYLSSSRRWNKWLLPIQITLYSIAIFTYVVPLMEKNLKLLEENEALYDDMHRASGGDPMTGGESSRGLKGEPYSGLTWNAYSKYCLSTRPNKIETQLRCSLLDEEMVRWEGTVKGVEILRVANYKRDMLSYVYPRLLRDMLTCWWGEQNSLDCRPNENCGHVQGFVEGRWRCNLNKWNEYTYLVRVQMDSGGMLKSSSQAVHLTASHEFGNFTRHLQANDEIWFEGALRSRTAAQREEVEPEMLLRTLEEPFVHLTSIGCLACHKKDLKFERTSDVVGGHLPIAGIVATVQSSLKYLLNAIFNPVLIFK